MTQRVRSSPVLGYNHNLRHGGRVFHVQTEDSGQSYARLHTHLFYEGTILSSKKQEYDPAAPEDAVRALMQQLLAKKPGDAVALRALRELESR
jgi:hypothetical protein